MHTFQILKVLKMFSNLWVMFWNQPVLIYEGNVSYSKKQWEHSTRFNPTSDKHPIITSQTQQALSYLPKIDTIDKYR